jgi:phenylglyoxylate dehydrogenase alpha subunit
MVAEKASRFQVLDGNRAAAYGAMLCRPDVVCAYPITPQTEILEQLYLFCAENKLSAEMVAPESEHSAMSVLRGASGCGGRTFTATAAQGLAFMFEPCIHVSTLRLPVVMVNVCREMIAPHSVTNSHQDAFMVRDNGWIQIHAQNCQDILDNIIMAYRLAEDPEILLPVMVCYDGYYLSHQWEPVEIPDQEKVDRFLPTLKMEERIDPDRPLTFGPFLPGELGIEYRYRQSAAMERAKVRFDEIDREFEDAFGRNYGGQIEGYLVDDADILLVAVGSAASTGKVAVDNMRERGVNAGLLNLRMVRPFPAERFREMAEGKKAVGVIDRNICFGWGCGTVFMEMKSALFDLEQRPKTISFVSGLCGIDITVDKLMRAIELTNEAAAGSKCQEVVWLDLE